MLNIQKILMKHLEGKKKEGDKSAEAYLSTLDKGESGASGENLQTELDKVSIFSVVSKEVSQEKVERVRGFYQELLDWAKKVYILESVLTDDFKNQFFTIIDKIIQALNSQDKELLQLCLSDYGNNEDALYYHVVNVSVISLELGKGLGYEKSKLMELGVASLMHDLGTIKFLELIYKQGKLSAEEFKKVQEHPLNGLEILNKIGGEFIPGIINVISQEHERMDGTGYPKGLREDQINEFAQIVGLADVYEAMTHLRPYRLRLSPPKAMNNILNKKSAFSTKVLKVLLERIGVFPVGTKIRLNTKEAGVVSRINLGLPLRPLVLVFLDEGGNKLAQPKLIDLSKNLLICIEECLDIDGDKAN